MIVGGTLTLAGDGVGRESSLVVHGSLDIQASLDNNAYVIADRAEPLILSTQAKTSSAGGYWIAEQDPATQSVGHLIVNTEVSGVGTWQLVDHPNARITINTACFNLSGPVDLKNGTLDAQANFWTSGNLVMQSVNGSAPVMQIAASQTTKFGN